VRVVAIYQAVVKLAEDRNSAAQGPLSFPSAEARSAYVKGREVYWYFLVEDDDWSWHRGGAWQATAPEDPQDREVIPPEITEADRWLCLNYLKNCACARFQTEEFAEEAQGIKAGAYPLKRLVISVHTIANTCARMCVITRLKPRKGIIVVIYAS
jgi:hypothetical protein